MYNNKGDIGQTGKLLSIVTEEYGVCALHTIFHGQAFRILIMQALSAKWGLTAQLLGKEPWELSSIPKLGKI